MTMPLEHPAKNGDGPPSPKSPIKSPIASTGSRAMVETVPAITEGKQFVAVNGVAAGASREEVEEFFENAGVALQIVAPDGTIARANAVARDMLGYSVREYVGRNIVEFHADTEAGEDLLRRFQCGESVDKYPARLHAKDGSTRHVQIGSRPEFRDGELVGSRCFMVDVTDLQRSHVDMLVDISDRKQAESLQQMLLNELNHRVKNNMQLLHALLQTSERETSNADARRVLSDVSQRVAAIAAAQKVLYDKASHSSFDAGQFLHEVCGIAQQTFGDDVQVEISPVAQQLANDISLPLALILNELLTNAVKHGVHGNAGGKVQVELRDAGDELLLSVADNGPGFERPDSRRRASGLGLVEGLAHQIGGSFDIECTNGARCLVRFPKSRRYPR